MNIRDHEFYKTWQPKEDSHAYKFVSEYVDARARLDGYTERTQQLWDIINEHQRTLANTTIYSDPTALALAKITVESAAELVKRCEALAERESKIVKDTQLALVRLDNELSAELSRVRQAVALDTETTLSRRYALQVGTSRRSWINACVTILGYERDAA